MPAPTPHPDRPRPHSSPRISPIAVLGTLVMVAGAVVFGVLGPRMGQRGMRIRGIPVTSLRDAALDEVLAGAAGMGLEDVVHAHQLVEPDPDHVVVNATRVLEKVLGPAVEPPMLVTVGFELTAARRLDLVDVPAVRLDYRSTASGEAAVLFELADPLSFVHFDTLGRQQPLLPGTRIQETIHLGGPGDRGLLPTIGLVILAVDGRATVVVTPDPDVADDIADALEPPRIPDSDSVIEEVAAILEGSIGPMSRS